jgi:hypothetical protein
MKRIALSSPWVVSRKGDRDNKTSVCMYSFGHGIGINITLGWL